MCYVGSCWLFSFGKELCALKEIFSQWQINKNAEGSELPLAFLVHFSAEWQRLFKNFIKVISERQCKNPLSSYLLQRQQCWDCQAAETHCRLRTIKGWMMVVLAGASSDCHPCCPMGAVVLGAVCLILLLGPIPRTSVSWKSLHWVLWSSCLNVHSRLLLSFCSFSFKYMNYIKV